MKANNKRSNILIYLFIFVFIAFYSTNSNAQPSNSIARSDPECTGNGGTFSLFGTTDCVFTPDLQKVTFYRLDLCNSKPNGPTTSLVTDRTNCSTFFKNDNGYEATITKNIINQIGSTNDFYALPFGNYKYGIIEIGSVFKYKTSVNFVANVGEAHGSNSSKTCVTKVSSLGTLYSYDSRATSYAKGNVDCSGTANAQEVSVGVNSLTRNLGDCFHAITYQGSNANIDAYLIESDGTLHDGVGAVRTDMIKSGSNGCTMTNNHGVEKIIGIVPFNIKIDRETNGIQIQYNNTKGIGLDALTIGGMANKIYQFKNNAFFDFNLTTK